MEESKNVIIECMGNEEAKTRQGGRWKRVRMLTRSESGKTKEDNKENECSRGTKRM